jgi:diguanylate cyclase (GGDEF)-like protein
MEKQKESDGDTTKLILAEELAAIRAMHEGQRATLIVLAGWEIGREFPIHETQITIGRSPDATVTIGLPSVSRHHASITFMKTEEDEYYEIADLNSMNGTRVNNEPIRTVRLNTNDKIQLGDVVLKFMLQDELDALFHHEVHRRIHYNDLTGLLTLESFKPHVIDEIAKGDKGKPFTLAMTDLDGLKKVNDTHGHLQGARVIGEMGAAIRANLRPRDRAGLYGGDEAIILYPGTTLDEASNLAESLRRSIAAMQLEHEGVPFGVTISQGLAEWPTHGRTLEQIIAAADGALYAAKGAGRNCTRSAEA